MVSIWHAFIVHHDRPKLWPNLKFLDCKFLDYSEKTKSDVCAIMAFVKPRQSK